MTARPGFAAPLLVAALLLAFLVVASLATAQVPREEFAARRARLVEALGEGVYYFEGAPSPRHDYEEWFQDAHFHYLTDFEEPDARLLLVAWAGETREILFVRERDPAREIWEGPRLGTRGAAELTGMEARALEEFDEVLEEALGVVLERAPEEASSASRPPVVALAAPSDNDTVSRIVDALGGAGSPAAGSPADSGAAASGAGVAASRSGARPAVEWIDPTSELRRLRAVKSAAEIELLRVASKITTEAHIAAMQATEPGMNEFEIEALVEYHFRRYGAKRPGFASIIGSGPHSTVLHYNADDGFMEAGDMLVMDIGAEYGHYTTDITRTIPVSGTFSPEQREIYEIVLAAQLAAEDTARERGVSWRAVSRAASRVLAEGLAGLGLIESPDARLPGGRPQLSLFYMHGLGHGIGLDVHDPNRRTMEPGNAFTIEPGLYIREDALDRIGEGPEADALRERLRAAVMKYREIGVRIEDAYAYTDDGLERLSVLIPRRVQEIEATMSGQSFANRHRNAALVELYRELQSRRQRHD